MTAVNNQITNPRYVAALPEGEAAVVDGYRQVVKINKTGQIIKELYNCHLCHDYIEGLLLLGSNLYVTHSNGTIVEIQPHTGDLLNVYNIPDVSYINHYGSLWSDPANIPNTDILLPDYSKYEVFSYNLTSRHKKSLLQVSPILPVCLTASITTLHIILYANISFIQYLYMTHPGTLYHHSEVMVVLMVI